MYQYKKENGKAIGTDGWDAEHDDSSTIYTGLWKDGQVVAILVGKPEDCDNDFEDMSKRFYEQSDEMVVALNAYPGLVEQNKALVEALTYARKWLAGQDGNSMLLEMGNPEAKAEFAKIDAALVGSQA